MFIQSMILKKLKKIEELIKNPVNKEENHKLMLEYIHAAFAKGQKNDISKENLFSRYCKEIERLTNSKV